MADKKVTVRIGAETKGLQKGIKSATGSLKNFAGGIAAAFGAREIARFTKESVQQFAKFEKGMLEVSTLANFSSKQLRKMGDETLSMSRKFGQGFDKLTKARYDIVSAGFASVSEQTKLLDVANKAAIGGVTDVSTATDLLTSTLNAYNLEATDAARASDIWFTTVQLGKTTIPELAASIGQLLPIAKTAGVTLEEAGGALATLTAAGIKTPRAVTGLGSAFLALTAPTAQASKAMKEAGIVTVDTAGKMIAFSDVIKQFEGKNLQEIMKLTGSKEAATVIASLAENYGKLDGNIKKVEQSTGATETAFSKMSGSTQMQLDQLGSSWTVLKVRVGEFVTTSASGISPVQRLTNLLGEWGNILAVDAKGVSNLRKEFAMMFDADDATRLKAAQERQKQRVRDEKRIQGDIEKLNVEGLKRLIKASELANIEIASDSEATQKRIAQARGQIAVESVGELKVLSDQMGADWRGAMDTFTPWWERTFGDMRETAESEIPAVLQPFARSFGGVLGGMKSSFSSWFSGIQGRRFTIFGTLIAKLKTTLTGGYTGGTVTAAGIMTGFQMGGTVGPTDTVAAMLTPDEEIINAKQSRKFRPLLKAINNDELPGFAGGGTVLTGRDSKGKATTRPVDPAAIVDLMNAPDFISPIQEQMVTSWKIAWQEEFGGGFGDLLAGAKQTGGIGLTDLIISDEELEKISERMEETKGMFEDFWGDMKAASGAALESMVQTGSDEMTNYFAALMTGTETGGKAVGKIFAAMLGDLAGSYGTFMVGKGIAVIAEGGWPPNPRAVAAGIGMIVAGSALKAIGPALMSNFHEGGIVGASQTGAPADIPINAQSGEAVLSRGLTNQLQRALDDGRALPGGGEMTFILEMNEREVGRAVGGVDLKRRGMQG